MHFRTHGIALGLFLTLTAASAGPNPGPVERAPKPDFDLRLPGPIEERGRFVMRKPGPLRRAALARLAVDPGDLIVRWDGMSGSPKRLAARGGVTLSRPSTDAPEDVARAFVAAYAGLFGLTVPEVRALRVTSTVASRTGAHAVFFTQTAGGLDTFDGRLQVNLLPDGAVQSVSASTYANLEPPTKPVVGPGAAVARAVADVYPEFLFTGAVRSEARGADRKTVFEQDEFGFPPTARLVVLPTAGGSRLAWEVRVAEPTLFTSYRILIDAEDGTLLYRVNTTAYAEARRLEGPRPLPKTEEAAPEGYTLATIPSSTAESPAGWIAGSGTVLEGNNAISYLGWREEPGLSEPSAVYDYPFNTTRSALVNIWWWTNEFHDWLYALGFDEQAGNFQEDNFGNGGSGGDAMGVVALEETPRNTAFFAAYQPDGTRSYIHFSWVQCRFCGDHDGLPEFEGAATSGERHLGYLRSIVIHEYMHGVSGRRVGGPADDTCLDAEQSQALGESWSDLIGRSRTGVLFDGIYEGSGINRRFTHDLDYGDFCKVADAGCQEHADSLIFSAAMWDLRGSMAALDPAGGIADWDQLVIEALGRTPCDPSMLDARDAVLDADTALFASAHHDLIWNAFAARGMGDDATTTGHADTDPIPGYAVAPGSECSAPPVPAITSAVPDGDNALLLTYDASGSSAVEVWREDLDNGFDRPARIGLTDDLDSFVDSDVQGGKSYRYHVVGVGAGGTTCRSGASGTTDGTATGSCDAYPTFVPGLMVSDDDPGCEVTLSWSPAAVGCPGSGQPIVYNVYRAPTAGFDPRDRLLIGRTTGTTFQDVPPENDEYPWAASDLADPTANYLVLAQHGTLDEPPDHRDRGSSQMLDWESVVPTLGRTEAHFWDFESGAQGWTTDNSADPSGGWVLVSPTGTTYGEMALAPDEASGGAGAAWVTGDGPGDIAEHDCDDLSLLISPVWDGTAGATLLSYDYWAVGLGNFFFGLELRIDNGTDTVSVFTVGHRTAQDFETDDAHGWQRGEIDLARWIAPTATMSVTFVGHCSPWFGEFGIDNVRVDSATTCARSGLALDSASFDDSPAGWGNGNGVLEPGETARVDVTLVNDGSTTAFGPQGTLRSSVPGVLVHEATASFPDIAPGATGSVLGGGFTVTARDDIACDETLVFDLEFVDAAGTVSHANWNPEFGATSTTTVFQDTFETDMGWIHQGFGGFGVFERGDPVGTTNGGDAANPEDDSPNDAGAQCYVTENGAPAGAADATDVDMHFTGVWPTLSSPWLDLSPYKRATLTYDLWLYDDSPSTPGQDYLQIVGDAQNGGRRSDGSTYETGNPSGWVTRTEDLTRLTPLTQANRVQFVAYDNSPDHIVEVGIDNVFVEGHQQVCDPLGVVDPPNGIGDTLRLDKVDGRLRLAWTASPIDEAHDGAAYYEIHRSAAPDGGFTVAGTSTDTTEDLTLDAVEEYYKISAVNAAGTSGDEPAP